METVSEGVAGWERSVRVWQERLDGERLEVARGRSVQSMAVGGKDSAVLGGMGVVFFG